MKYTGSTLLAFGTVLPIFTVLATPAGPSVIAKRDVPTLLCYVALGKTYPDSTKYTDQGCKVYCVKQNKVVKQLNYPSNELCPQTSGGTCQDGACIVPHPPLTAATKACLPRYGVSKLFDASLVASGCSYECIGYKKANLGSVNLPTGTACTEGTARGTCQNGACIVPHVVQTVATKACGLIYGPENILDARSTAGACTYDCIGAKSRSIGTAWVETNTACNMANAKRGTCQNGECIDAKAAQTPSTRQCALNYLNVQIVSARTSADGCTYECFSTNNRFVGSAYAETGSLCATKLGTCNNGKCE